MRYVLILALSLLFFSCSSPIEKAMNSKHPAIKNVKRQLKNHEVQILFTQIDSTEDGEIAFIDHAFQVDDKNYFYPASTVKLPVALLAAEAISRDSTLNLDVLYKSSRDEAVHNVAGDINQIFAVSDNESYNRLYEFLGRDEINNRLKEKGLSPVRISHRLSTTNADAAARTTLKFFPTYEGETVIKGGTSDGQISNITARDVKKGVGYMFNDSLVYNPMDFSKKNYFPLQSQHNLMKRFFFPEQFSVGEQFNIETEEATRIKQMMRTAPRKAGYDEEDYYDSYGKFFMYGDSTDRIPEHVKIYNKVGYAYGTLTETAYIVDERNGIHFLLSATILVNANGIFNDDKYEYDTVGIPFLAQLGRELYQLERERKDSHAF